MITTRNINVDLSKEKLKLRHVTTKDIDVGVRVEPPKVPIKTKSITTTTLPDIADIAEKKRRDDIAVEKKLTMKDEKKIALAEKKVKLIKPSKKLMAELKEVGRKLITDAEKAEEKKPWNKMNTEERKAYQKTKAKKKEGN